VDGAHGKDSPTLVPRAPVSGLETLPRQAPNAGRHPLGTVYALLRAIGRRGAGVGDERPAA